MADDAAARQDQLDGVRTVGHLEVDAAAAAPAGREAVRLPRAGAGRGRATAAAVQLRRHLLEDVLVDEEEEEGAAGCRAVGGRRVEVEPLPVDGQVLRAVDGVPTLRKAHKLDRDKRLEWLF